MRRSPSRVFAVALALPLTLGLSVPVAAAEPHSWNKVGEFLTWFEDWWNSLTPAGKSTPLPTLERETLFEGAAQDPYGRLLPPPGVMAPQEAEHSDLE